jgi:hypothetical protein
METREFIEHLIDYAAKYKIWWCEPFEKFREQYKHKGYSHHEMEQYRKALNDFRESLRQENDLLGEIHQFLDQNYRVYIEATPEERSEIRKIINESEYPTPKGGKFHFLEDLLFNYTNDWALKNLKETGDRIWLLRGLVSRSMENCGIDYRDTITQLTYLYIAAQEKGIDPEVEFQTVAQVSSDEKTRGGCDSISHMMATTRNLAYYRERTKSFSKK